MEVRCLGHLEDVGDKGPGHTAADTQLQGEVPSAFLGPCGMTEDSTGCLTLWIRGHKPMESRDGKDRNGGGAWTQRRSTSRPLRPEPSHGSASALRTSPRGARSGS